MKYVNLIVRALWLPTLLALVLWPLLYVVSIYPATALMVLSCCVLFCIFCCLVHASIDASEDWFKED